MYKRQIQDSPKPIVLTGSQKPMGNPFTDAKLNLYQSLLYAVSYTHLDVYKRQVLLSAAFVLGGNALLDAGWGSALRSIADRVLPNPEIAMWAPAPEPRCV